MRQGSKRKRITGIVAASALLLIFICIYALINRPAKTNNVYQVPSATAAVEDKKNLPGLPVRLEIPKLKIDANVIQVGVTEDGAMDTPKTPDDVAWYEPGQRPGGVGTSVITGHFGWTGGEPAVFDDLSKLEKGDKLQIEDEKGIKYLFVVSETRLYGPNDDAKEVFTSNDDKAHLNLITCTGSWNKEQKSYSSRLVIFAELDTE